MIVGIFKLVTLELLSLSWNHECGDFSKFWNASNEFANLYLYGSWILPLEDLEKPFESHSTPIKAFVAVIHLIQKYQTIFTTFHHVMSFVGSYAARNVASSAITDLNCSLEASYVKYHRSFKSLSIPRRF